MYDLTNIELKNLIAELNIPNKIYYALDEANILTVGDLIKKSEREVVHIKGVGVKGSRIIIDCISKLKEHV